MNRTNADMICLIIEELYKIYLSLDENAAY